MIGIDGRYTLVDGTSVTQPRYAFWFEGSGWGVENHGVDPDVEVEIAPQDWAADRDPQLDDRGTDGARGAGDPTGRDPAGPVHPRRPGGRRSCPRVTGPDPRQRGEGRPSRVARLTPGEDFRNNRSESCRWRSGRTWCARGAPSASGGSRPRWRASNTATRSRCVYRSFELDPTTPRTVEGNATQRLADKYGVPLAQAEAMQQRVIDQAAGEGLDFRFDRARPGNTVDAHRLLHLAADRGLQAELKERLLLAYFTEGEPIGEVDALVRLAGEVGLDEAEARSVLESDAYLAEVRDDQATARALGISGRAVLRAGPDVRGVRRAAGRGAARRAAPGPRRGPPAVDGGRRRAATPAPTTAARSERRSG